MGGIVRLPDDLCNQIAAGEVVERPASVVKELVENAIDAKASRIQIDIGTGGIGVVRITDDGVGMDEHDARLALERHATSKIAAVDDLLRLRTFGFRGEALPSIASVSKFTIRTRQHDADAGTEVSTDSNSPLRIVPCGIAPGTIVEARELFHNVPARRKFLKSTGAESAAITQVVEGLALSQPSITFILNRDGRNARQWLRASCREERAKANKPNDKLECIKGQRGPLQIEGYLSPPERARTGATGLVVLINGRVVRDRILARVIAQAYGSVLESGRYPVGVVYVEIDPALVDVNVHPQKAEVRFANARAVQDSVFRVVTEGLAGAFGLAPASRAFLGGNKGPVTPQAMTPPWLQDTSASSLSVEPQISTSTPDPWGLNPERANVVSPTQPPLGLQPGVGARPTDSNHLSVQDPQQVQHADAHGTDNGGAATIRGDVAFGNLRFLAQLRSMFLLCEGVEGLVIIDQHAAAERVTFAKYRAAYAAQSVASQRLLVPQTFAVDAEEVAYIEQASAAIEAAGLELRVVGPTQALVTAVPQLLRRGDPERLARDLLDEARRMGGRGFSDAVDRAMATMACHGSIRSGDVVSPQEAASLLRALDEVQFGGHCPHGRPLLMKIRYAELERLVGRR
ncbi:MAG: DNA mismatch repair protein MutL [Sorangium cellulosum]|nr:MAG: DNA mismatch repair protein MutL [Sorangium cellulosum]